ncbi:MAG: hydroxymethylbilane synthase [Ignavibacteriales bacterium]|nr:hydroxymethylbilane synthase [Ignavibacteriales bacterium]
MKSTSLRIGTRGSQLALWQAEWVKAELLKFYPNLTIQLEIIKTTGDNILDSPLSKIGDKGLFTKEIENALLENRIDIAVHSLKDLPTKLPNGLTIGAIPKREEVNDVFISHPSKYHKDFDSLPSNSKIATGSLRRKCQLLNWKPDLEIYDLRGNLNTRLTKLEQSDWDGIILAKAGVVRLGFAKKITQMISIDKILPAVGQGALGIEIREQDKKIEELIKPLNNFSTSYCVLAERSFLRMLEGGCQVPIGAYAQIEDNQLHIQGMIGSLDGKKILRGSANGPAEQCEKIGAELAKTLSDCGGKEILESIRMI